jgi:hypothetical protein
MGMEPVTVFSSGLVLFIRYSTVFSIIPSNHTSTEDEALLFLSNLVFYHSTTPTQLTRRSLFHL